MNRRKSLEIISSVTLLPNLVSACKSNQATNTVVTDTAESDLKGFKVLSPEGNLGIGKRSNKAKTDGLYMKIEKVGDLTITDAAWETHKLSDHYKRWKFDDQLWQSTPLVNYKFSEAYRNRPVSIVIALYHISDYIYPRKIYQQLVLLS